MNSRGHACYFYFDLLRFVAAIGGNLSVCGAKVSTLVDKIFECVCGGFAGYQVYREWTIEIEPL